MYHGLTKKKVMLAGIPVFSVAFLVLCWFIAARITLDKIIKQHQGNSDTFQLVRSMVLDSQSQPKSSLDFKDLERYRSYYPKFRDQINQTVQDLTENSIMAFWFPGSRELICMEISRFIANEDTIHQAVCVTVDHLAPISDEFQKLYGNVCDAAEEARTSITRTSDIKQYQEHSKRLNSQKNDLNAFDKRLEARQNSEELQGISEQFRQGALLHMRDELNRQREAVELRNKSVKYAAQTLKEYKAALNRTLFQESGIIYSMNAFAMKYYPSINYANTQIGPLRNVLAELNKPIINMGGLSKVIRTDSFTAMSLIRVIDPNIGHSIEALNTMCKILETSDTELKQIFVMSQKFIRAAEQYRGTRSRSDMLYVLDVSPEVKAYFNSKMTLFDPVFVELDKAESSVRMIESAVRRLNNQTASNLICECTQLAHTIINSAKTPCQQSKDILGYSAELMTDIEGLEEKYQLALNALASENPGFEEVSFSIDRDAPELNVSTFTPTNTSGSIYMVYNTAKDTPDEPYLNLRSGPGASNSIVAHMPDGSRVRVMSTGLGSSGRWWKVHYMDQNKTGYAHSKWLRKIN